MKALIDDEEFFGMMNIGYNPTVGGSEKTIETYFFNLDKNLYGKKLQIEMELDANRVGWPRCTPVSYQNPLGQR